LSIEACVLRVVVDPAGCTKHLHAAPSGLQRTGLRCSEVAGRHCPSSPRQSCSDTMHGARFHVDQTSFGDRARRPLSATLRSRTFVVKENEMARCENSLVKRHTAGSLFI